MNGIKLIKKDKVPSTGVCNFCRYHTDKACPEEENSDRSCTVKDDDTYVGYFPKLTDILSGL